MALLKPQLKEIPAVKSTVSTPNDSSEDCVSKTSISTPFHLENKK